MLIQNAIFVHPIWESVLKSSINPAGDNHNNSPHSCLNYVPVLPSLLQKLEPAAEDHLLTSDDTCKWGPLRTRVTDMDLK